MSGMNWSALSELAAGDSKPKAWRTEVCAAARVLLNELGKLTQIR
jgi:hypothetical protein